MPEPKSAPFRDIAIGLGVGITSGLFGVGGGIVLVPLLVLLFKTEQKKAQATSLVVAALAALTGATTYSLGGSVVWESVGFLLLGGLTGTWLGTSVLKRIADRWLKLAFGILLLLVAARTVFASLDGAVSKIPQLSPSIAAGYVAAGLAMGLLSSFLGVGGGVIVIPILVLLFGFSQQLAAGTSLVVMIPVVLYGAMRLTKSGFTNWRQGVRIGIPGAFGAVVGASVALVAQGSIIQLGFALLLVLAGGQMIWRSR